jgi:TolB-like protein
MALMTASQSDATPAALHESIREALDKVLSSEAFQGSERSRTLLRFVVERTLSGQTGGLKEYTLGTEALGRSSAFDPRTDTVVRSEVSRLRTRLDKYYATQGQHDEVVIALSKGSYVPRFERRTIAANPRLAGEPKPALRRRALLASAACALFAAIALVSYRELLPPLSLSPDVKVDRAVAATSVSIAVLPFLNLSGDPGQDFFADGLTEELTAALARIPNVLVVGGTSASQFKSERGDLRIIGRALNVTHLIEGSVRKEEDRFRITAQLVRADSGMHVWTESYDRQTTGMVALQEDVATAIAGALELPLRLGRDQTPRPRDEETYELFLRGRAAWRARRTEEALRFLDQAVTRDPNFAPAWRLLDAARNGDNIERRLRGAEQTIYPESRETLARKVIALAPSSADGYAMLANLAAAEGKWSEAMDLRKQALLHDPNDVEVMNAYANDLWTFGYLKEALAVRDRQHVLEPLIPIYNFLRAEVLAANGMLDQAVRDWLAATPDLRFGMRLLAPAYAELGRFDDAIDIVLRGVSPVGDPQPYTQAEIEAAVQVLRAAANKAPPAPLPDLEGELTFAYAYSSTPGRILDNLEKEAKASSSAGVLRYVWWPTPSSVRGTERFKTVVRNAGFVDVWRARGWPDLCRPVGADDFECD